MSGRLLRKSLVYLLFYLPWTLVAETETDRWAAELAASLPPGQVQYLDAAGDTFLAVYTEQIAPAPVGGVILLHDTEAHPDWREVVSPLRQELPNHGWSTLALHLPVAAEPAAFPGEMLERIRAGVEFLRSKGVQNIVLAGHGWGAVTAVSYLGSMENHGISAVVAIGMPATDPDSQISPLLEKIEIPVFDLYGSQDLAAAAGARQRAVAAARADNTSYQRLEVLGADHFFVGLSDFLVKRIQGWLHRYAKAATETTEPTEQESQP